MKNTFLVPVLASILAGCASHGTPSPRPLSTGAVMGSIVGGGRNIMRSPEGTLITAFAEARPRSTQLYFAGSRDDGQTWYRVASPHLGRHSPGTDDGNDPAIDSNVDGAYLAFVDAGVGRVVYSAQPFANPARFQHSAPLTPAGVAVRHSFVAASRMGWGDRPADSPASVAYGWVDVQNGDIYVGLSRDGRTFPVARRVQSDLGATTGPAVAVHGDYILLMYLSRSARFAPEGLESGPEREYQVWMESRDGGQTWSDPTPLFGRTLADFPRIPTVEVDAAGRRVTREAVVGGGSPGSREHSQALAWGPTPSEKVIFVMSSLRPLRPDGRTVTDAAGAVGVVSFKPLAPGGAWTHVVANRALTLDSAAPAQPAGPGDARFAPAGARAELHQYSALPETPFRAVTYVESDRGGGTRLVVVLSPDAGKNFNQYIVFGRDELARLGVPELKGRVVIDVSQCLYEDRAGNVYQDVLLLDEAGGNALYQLKLPLGVNARSHRVAQQ